MSPGEPWPTGGEKTRRFQLAVLGVMALLALLAGLLWTQGAEQRAIDTLEPGKRMAVFQQSFASFEALCHEDPGGALTSDCRRQARFLRQFPECEGACRTEVSRYIGGGTR